MKYSVKDKLELFCKTKEDSLIKAKMTKKEIRAVVDKYKLSVGQAKVIGGLIKIQDANGNKVDNSFDLELNNCTISKPQYRLKVEFERNGRIFTAHLEFKNNIEAKIVTSRLEVSGDGKVEGKIGTYGRAV